MPLPALEVSATITSSLLPVRPDVTTLILDIDTWRDAPAGESATDDAIAGHLATLRQAKNYVFEACITDATRGLIQ